jgi:hypothetical protein
MTVHNLSVEILDIWKPPQNFGKTQEQLFFLLLENYLLKFVEALCLFCSCLWLILHVLSVLVFGILSCTFQKHDKNFKTMQKDED